MKKIAISILLIIAMIPSQVHASSGHKHSKDNQPIQEELYKGSLFSLLFPYIQSETEKHYESNKQFDLYDAKILSIKKSPELYEFEIVVQVETFTGAHNPPRGIETITILTSPMGTKVTNFKHEAE